MLAISVVAAVSISPAAVASPIPVAATSVTVDAEMFSLPAPSPALMSATAPAVAVKATLPEVATVPTDRLPVVETMVMTPLPVVAVLSVAPSLSMTTTSPVPAPVRLSVVAVVLSAAPGTPMSPSAPPAVSVTAPPLIVELLSRISPAEAVRVTAPVLTPIVPTLMFPVADVSEKFRLPAATLTLVTDRSAPASVIVKVRFAVPASLSTTVYVMPLPAPGSTINVRSARTPLVLTSISSAASNVRLVTPPKSSVDPIPMPPAAVKATEDAPTILSVVLLPSSSISPSVEVTKTAPVVVNVPSATSPWELMVMV